MADFKISDLPQAGAALGSQEHEVNDSGVSRRLSNSQIAAYVKAETSAEDIGALASTNNLSDVADAVAAFDNIKQPATSDNSGVANFSTMHRKNLIINGNFDIWQRGTSFPNVSSGTFGPDRFAWQGDAQNQGGVINITRQDFTPGQTEVPGNPKYYVRVNQQTASSGSIGSNFRQRIEGVQTLSGETVTISFYARASGAHDIGISLVQNFGTGGSPSNATTTNLSTESLTSNWQKFVVTGTLPSISGKTIGSNGNDYLQLQFELPLNVAAYVEIAQVQLEKGNVATDFEYRPIGEELALCQRYYANAKVWHRFHSTAVNQIGGSGVFFPVEMRTSPAVSNGSDGTVNNTSDSAIANVTRQGCGFHITASATGSVLIYGRTITADAEL